MKKYVFSVFCLCLTIVLNAQVNFNDLSTKRVVSDSTIFWKQVSPGNAGFANLVRYHPTIPGKVSICPDMWNAYQSNNNGTRWYGTTDPDGDGSYNHLRDLYYSYSDPSFALSICSSELFMSADTGRTWAIVPNCPWYVKDTDGSDKEGWKSKVGSLGIDPEDKNIWFVGGGSNVRGQDWLSCYMDINNTNPHGTTELNEGKLWRTTDAGSSWTLVNSGLDSKAQVGRIIVNPIKTSQVFASSNYGLYRSDNGGTNWVQISSGKLDNDIIMDMDFYYNAQTNKFVLYLIDQVQYRPNGTTTTCTGGIFYSEDEGNTWTKINGDLGLNINQLTGGVPDNYYKYIAAWFNITQDLAKTTYPVLPTAALQYFNMLAVDPSREGALFIGFADPQVANSIMPGRVWTTSNNGQKWINTARLYGDIWANDKNYCISRGNPYNANMVVGHASDHMQSGNNYPLRSTRGIACGVDGSVMMISDHSTMLSTDHGDTWHQVDEDSTPSGALVGHGNSNLPGLTIAQDVRNKITLLGSGEHNLWIPANDSPDDRIAIRYISNAQLTVSSMAFDPYNPQTVYSTSSRQANKQNIFKSTDGGYNWTNYGVATPATTKWLDDFYTNALTIDPINSKYFYFGITKIVDETKGTLAGFYCSDNEGKTFTQRNNGLPSPVRIRDIKFDPRDNSCASLFAAAENNEFNQEFPVASGGLFHTSDRGLTWTEVNTPDGVKGVNAICIDQSNRLYITTGYRGAGLGVWYTDNWGTSWSQIFSYPGAQNIDVSPFDRNLIVVSVEHMSLNPGIYVSRDRGITWSKSNYEIVIPHKIEEVKFDLMDPGKMWAATLGCGFYRGTIKNGNKVQVVDIAEGAVESSDGKEFKLNASIVNSEHVLDGIVWKSDNTAIATVDANGLVTPVGKGNAKIWATTTDGRYSDYSVVVVTNNPSTSIQSNKTDAKLVLYPNPAGHEIKISGIEQDVKFSIFSMTGTELVSGSGKTIDLTKIPVGPYLLKLTTENDIVVRQFIKE